MDGTSTCLMDDDALSSSDETLDDTEKCNSSCSVNYQMIPAKLSCFFYQASCSMRNFLVLFYVSCGFDAAEAGSLNGLQLLGGIIATPFLSFLADVTGWHKGIATILCIMAALATNIQPLLDKLYGDPCKNVCPHEANYRINSTMCHTFPSRSQELISITESNKNKLFYLLLLVSIVATGFENSISSFIDGGVIRRIETCSKQSTYGCQLVFDPIGHAMGGLLYSLAIKYFNRTNIPCNSGMFIAYFFLMIACAFSVGWLFHGIAIEKEQRNGAESHIALLVSTFRQLETIFFFILVLTTGILEGLWFGFLFLRLKELHASTLLLGYSQALSTISAILMFNTGDKFVRKLQGPMGAMCMTFLLWGIRYIISALVKTPYLIMVAELLDGVSFMLFKVGSLEYIREKSDALILTSVCGISSTLLTIGVVLGNMVGGILYRTYGGSILFFWTSIGCFSFAFLIVLFMIVKKWSTKYSHAYRLI